MPLRPPCDLFVLAGEASGDAYGAAVVEHLRPRLPDLICAGFGGQALAGAGCEIEERNEGLAVMGFLPVLARLPTFLALKRRLRRAVIDRRARAVLGVDYPGFNLRLARSLGEARQRGTRLIHLVAPQVWAWRPRRAKAVAHSVDRLLCLFPFEPALFNRFGAARADFVGHPLADLVPLGLDCAPIASELGLRPHDRLLLVAPGSRAKEIEALLPVMDEAVQAALPRLAAERGGRVVAAIAKASETPRDLYRRHSDLPLIEGRYRELCARAHVGLIASGTATLEAAIIGLPHVICYRTDPLSARLVRQLLRVEHIGLTNIVHGERVCPEVLQDQLDSPRLVAHLATLWSGERREAVRARLAT
ncbi:MAG: lipid-A-disaccharide synthase, partial [Planctomycetes bacterium]|nr:lipid-A-disaccharide synthase [Planctomycetota bacterium]